MRLLADEGVESQVVERLRADGHDVEYVAELAPGISDDEVFSRAKDGRRVLMTVDKDFGEIVFRLGRVTTGVLLLRLSGVPSAQRASLVSDALRDHGDQMHDSFAVLSSKTLRIRKRL